MLSSNLRGGVSFAAQRYTESAVYEDLTGKPRTLDAYGRFNVLLDLDANNLYGSSQMGVLPFGNLELITDKKHFQDIDWSSIDLMGEIGYFTEVTLEYPESLWEKTKSFPFCPQNLDITEKILSPYQKSVLKTLYGLKKYKSSKLTSTFFPREKIVLHALALQFYLRHGMILKEVHRVIKFSQKKFMAPWIEFCTQKRSESKNDFEKNFWKLQVNSVYGKTIENVENRFKVSICTVGSSFSEKLNSPLYLRHEIINPDLAIVFEHYEKLNVKRPYYIGFSILEISKLIMYDFFYNVLQDHFGEKGVELIYSDTDSLAIQVKTTDILKDFSQLSFHMDFSNLDPSHPLYDPKNKAQLFKLKEEFGFKPLSRLCAIKSKVYSFEMACNHDIGMGSTGSCLFCRNKRLNPLNINRLKGIQKKTARQIHFEKYLKCVTETYIQRNTINQISSKRQKLSSLVLNKISLSSFDDKRYVFNCGVHTEPYSDKNSPFCPICDI